MTAGQVGKLAEVTLGKSMSTFSLEVKSFEDPCVKKIIKCAQHGVIGTTHKQGKEAYTFFNSSAGFVLNFVAYFE